jgi:hypothetical protein
MGCMCSNSCRCSVTVFSVSSIAVASNSDEQLCAVIAVLNELGVDDKCHVIYIDV